MQFLCQCAHRDAVLAIGHAQGLGSIGVALQASCKLLHRATDYTYAQSSIQISRSGWSCLPVRPVHPLARRAIAAASPSAPCSTAACRATWQLGSNSRVAARRTLRCRPTSSANFAATSIVASLLAVSLRAHCGQCGHDFLIAYSCKGRGVCPACNARRMVETAAHLTDHVMPRLAVRQWVLSAPQTPALCETMGLSKP